MQNRRIFIQKNVFSLDLATFLGKIIAQNFEQNPLLNRKIEEAIYALFMDLMRSRLQPFLPVY